MLMKNKQSPLLDILKKQSPLLDMLMKNKQSPHLDMLIITTDNVNPNLRPKLILHVNILIYIMVKFFGDCKHSKGEGRPYCTMSRVFVVLPMVPLVGNICTIGTNGIAIFTVCTNFYTYDTIDN